MLVEKYFNVFFGFWRFGFRFFIKDLGLHWLIANSSEDFLRHFFFNQKKKTFHSGVNFLHDKVFSDWKLENKDFFLILSKSNPIYIFVQFLSNLSGFFFLRFQFQQKKILKLNITSKVIKKWFYQEIRPTRGTSITSQITMTDGNNIYLSQINKVFVHVGTGNWKKWLQIHCYRHPLRC